MLETCPECGLPVSSAAVMCPHCGYPMKESKGAAPIKRRTNKRRRLPNGFGQISEIKTGNLRKPFRAMVTVGKSPTGRPICQLLKPDGYFATYNEAYEALVMYHKNPYHVDENMTMNELFEQWIKRMENVKSRKYVVDAKRCWMYLTSLYDVPVARIRVMHVKDAIEAAYVKNSDSEIQYASPDMKIKIKTNLNMMLDFAMECGIIEHNYARDCKNVDYTKNLDRDEHIAFTKEEMDILWKNAGMKYVDIILINCYMGWRPSELCEIHIADVNIESWTMTGGMKTEAGQNRIVPIHPKIKDLVKERYLHSRKINSQYFLNQGDKHISYRLYYQAFSNVIKKLRLNPEHRPHDCRKTFVTKAKAAKLDEYAIKRLAGHRIDDITERVYTERPVSWLREEIEKIE